MRRAGWEVGLPRSRALTVRGMEKKKAGKREPDTKACFDESNKAAEGQQGATPPPPGGTKKKSPRARVKEAQMSVIENVKTIIDGNCESAKGGNYKCAEFVLDWSGASDIRTPLSKATKRSLIATLLKQAKIQETAKKEEDEG